MTDLIRLETTEPEIEGDVLIEDETAFEEMYKILIHNDEATPMEFVIAILVRVFERPLIIAEAIMWEAHNNGNAVVMAAPLADATKRVNKAHFAARLEGYPLQFTIEPA